MKKNYFFLTAIFAFFAMAFVSCNTSGYEYELNEPIAVNLRANINSLTTARVANDQWQAGDQVGLFMVRAGQPLSSTSIVNGNHNVRMTIENGVLVSNPPVMFPVTGNVDFIAYYPFTINVNHFPIEGHWEHTILVNVANQSAGLPTEVLFSNNITNQAPTTNPVTLNFHYSLAKLEITVTGFSATDLADMTVNIEGMYTRAHLQLRNGTFASHSEKQPITMHRIGSNATSASFSALVLPTNEEITFLFDAGGMVNRHTMTVDFASAHLYRLNFSFDFNSQFPETTLSLLNAIITPREVNTQDISAIGTPLSVEINGVRWATRNVDMPGTFAANPEDAGMLFQWNRRIGWNNTNPMVNSDGGTVWDDTAATGTVWEAENDPCPPGWRVPTRQELESLLNAGSARVRHNGINGRLFGTAPYQLFLPAGGMRTVTGGLLYDWREESGRFWSSTQSYNVNSVLLSFSYTMRPSVHAITTRRSEAYSVRCVAE